MGRQWNCTRVAVVLFSLSALGVSLWAQTINDPLTSSEADQVRSASINPKKRMELLMSFAMDRLQRFRSGLQLPDPNVHELYGLLRQYSEITNELDDNLNELAGGYRTGEMGAPPKIGKLSQATLSGEQSALQQLLQLRTHMNAATLSHYKYDLDDAVDATKGVIDDAQHALNVSRQKALAKKKHSRHKFW